MTLFPDVLAQMEKKRLILILMMAMAGTQAHAEFVAPMTWSGAVEYGYSRAEYENGGEHTGNTLTARIRNRTYFWRPWFVTMNTGLALTRAESSGDDYSNENSFVTGNMDLNILPQSRFPLSIGYERSDSRIDNERFDADDYFEYGKMNFTRERWRLSQRYLGGNYNVHLYHTQQTLSDEQGSEQEDIASGANYTLRMKDQMLELQALERETDNNEGGSTENSLLSANHSLTTRDGLINTFLASRSETTQNFSEESGVDYHTARVRQASNNTLWRSRDNRATTNFGLRAFATDHANATDTLTTEGGSVSLGASYRYTPNIQFNGAGNYTLTETEDSETVYRSANIGASYTSDSHDIGRSQYRYHFNSTAKHADNNGNTSDGIDLSGGHSLSRRVSLSKYSTFRTTGSQTFTWRLVEDEATEEEGARDETIAMHSLSMSWTSSTSAANSYLQLALNDRRSLEETDNSQMATFQASRRQELSRRASLNGNISYNWSEAEIGTPIKHYQSESGHAAINYEFHRPFRIQNIRFRSSLRHSIINIQSADEQAKTYFENRLMHHIGKTDSTLSLTYLDQNSVASHTLWLKIKRSF